MQRGTLTYQLQRIHAKYGDMVRVAPDEVSFTDAAAWHDIHGHRGGHREFEKNPLFQAPPGKAYSIINAPYNDHRLIRRLLSHAFSETALREQEPVLQSYVDTLIRRLHE